MGAADEQETPVDRARPSEQGDPDDPDDRERGNDLDPAEPEDSATASVRPVVTLRQERATVDDLAAASGEFAVACRETGTSPEPVDGATFETFQAAERARDAARRYRAVLRSLDPGLDRYELAVCSADAAGDSLTRVRQRTEERRENGLPASRQTVTLTGDGCSEWLRVENGPIVHLAGPDALLDDELVSMQLDSSLHSQ